MQQSQLLIPTPSFRFTTSTPSVLAYWSPLYSIHGLVFLKKCLYQRINIGNARVNKEWLNLACNVLTKHWLVNMWMQGTTTLCKHATVTRTHGRKNARGALMHACPSTRPNTHGHTKCSTMNMWMWGTTTSCMHATVTHTHGCKNARDALMHARPSTRRNTHGHAQVLNLHMHAHTYSVRVS